MTIREKELRAVARAFDIPVRLMAGRRRLVRVCACGHSHDWHRHFTRSTRCSYTGFASDAVTVTARCDCRRFRLRRVRFSRFL